MHLLLSCADFFGSALCVEISSCSMLTSHSLTFTFSLRLQESKGGDQNTVGDQLCSLCNLDILCYRLTAVEALKIAWELGDRACCYDKPTLLWSVGMTQCTLNLLIAPLLSQCEVHFRNWLPGPSTSQCCTVSNCTCHLLFFVLVTVEASYNGMKTDLDFFRSRQVSV